MSRFAAIVVHCASWLVPASLRPQWREEWLNELATVRAGLWKRIAGAPRDAVAYRRYHAHRLARVRTGGSAWRADLRQACRELLRSPGYSAVVIAGLSLGLTATLAMFSTISSIRWGDPAGVVNRSELRRLVAEVQWNPPGTRPSESITAFSIETVRQLEKTSAGTIGVAARDLRPVNVRAGSQFHSTIGAFVSADYFSTLGTRPAAGRLLNRADDRPDSSAAVISHALWRDAFGSRSDIVGQQITVGGIGLTVLGVTPPGFDGRFTPPAPGHAMGPSVWLPLSALPHAGGRQLTRSLDVTLRVTQPETQSYAASASLAQAVSLDNDLGAAQIVARLMPVGGTLNDSDALEFAAMSALLLAGPLAVLAVACANVANMRLARGTTRMRELSVRAALGADRRQLVRLLAMESAILTVIVLSVSWLGTRSALVTLSSWLAFDLRLDVRAAIAAGVLGAATLFTSGLIPAWLVVRRSGLSGLHQTALAGNLAHSRLRNGLVVLQVAASVVLLVVTGLAAQSLQILAARKAPILDELVVANLDFGLGGYDAADAKSFLRKLTDRLDSNTLVSSVGVSTSSLFSSTGALYAPGDSSDTRERAARLTYVSPEWFSAMNVRPVTGRLLQPGDGPDRVVIDESIAASIAPEKSAVGLTLQLKRSSSRMETPSEPVEVVGVIRSMPVDPTESSRGAAIVRPLVSDAYPFVALYVRTTEPEATVQLVRELVGSQDGRGPWAVIETADAIVRNSTNPVRAVALASSGLAGVSVVLSAIGLAGLTAYVVSLRRREIGIRLALGGRTGSVVVLVLRQSLRLVLIGAGLGVIFAFPTAMLLSDGFVGVSPSAAGTFWPPLSLLFAVSILATALPARRAARVNPLEVLRHD